MPADSSKNPTTEVEETLDHGLPVEAYKRGTFGPAILILLAGIQDVEGAKTEEDAVRLAETAVQEAEKRLKNRRRDELEPKGYGFKYCGLRSHVCKRAAARGKDWIWEDSTGVGPKAPAYRILVRGLDHFRSEIEAAEKHLTVYKRPGQEDDNIPVPTIRRKARPTLPVDYNEMIGGIGSNDK